MPMFYTPKPHRFQYTPRLYDPKKEEQELLKTKYRLQQGLPIDDEAMRAHVKAEEQARQAASAADADEELAYFQQKVRDHERQERQKRNKLSFKDIFRKRETPKFRYTSRFDANGNLVEPAAKAAEASPEPRRIRHRFDTDDDGLQPVPAGKIMLTSLAVILLLLFIFN